MRELCRKVWPFNATLTYSSDVDIIIEEFKILPKKRFCVIKKSSTALILYYKKEEDYTWFLLAHT